MVADYAGLRQQVDADDGLHTTTMEVLRDIHKAGRLGVHVRDAISQQLAAHGMGHLPDELPASQEQEVRVYRRGTPTEDVINAVLRPSSRGDQVLRQVATSQSQEIVKRLRELVCE